MAYAFSLTSASSSSSTWPGASYSRSGSVSDSSFAPPPFRGLPSEDSATWLTYFIKYVTYRIMSNEQKMAFLPLMLRDVATEWWDVLPDDIRTYWEQALAAFTERFVDNDVVKWQKAGQFWNRTQATGEPVDEYAASLQKIAKSMGVREDVLKQAFMRCLRPNLRSYVIQSNATTLEGLIKAASVAEIAAAETCQSTTPDPLLNRVLELGEQNAAELKRSTARVATSSSVSTVQRTPPSTSRSPSPASRRVSFADEQQRRTRPVQYLQSGQQTPRIFGQRPPSRFSFRGNACDVSVTSACLNCGSWHAV